MPEPLAHVYDLALRALDEQERRVAQLHARLTPVLAGGGVGITLLTRPAFAGSHPDGVAEVATAAIGLLGIAVATGAAVYLLLAERLSFAPEPLSATEVAWRQDFFPAMVVLLDERRVRNLVGIKRLQAAFTVMVCGMLVGVCGLAVAVALA